MVLKSRFRNIKDGYPIIIKPNIGQPILLNLNQLKANIRDNGDSIKFEMLILANSSFKKEDIERIFSNRTYIQPLLKDHGEFQERRGSKKKVEINSAIRLDFIDFRTEEYASEELCEVWDINRTLKKRERKASKRKQLFKCHVEIDISPEILEILKQNSFILFDLIVKYPQINQSRTNYHSIAIYDKEWTEFNFIHASDTHIARRNDFIHKYLKVKELKRIKKNLKKGEKQTSYLLDREFQFKEEFQEENLERFRHGKYNFNSNLRLFISTVNEMSRKGILDFIIITGDLVDYVDTANNDEYYDNNFQFFLDILLGVNRDPNLNDKELLNITELTVPIFTTIGNHDYRKGHYSIKAGNLFKRFGLKNLDIKDYKDEKFFNYFKAIYSRTKFLKDYLMYINPNLNFKVEIGDEISLIFLDTGIDSIADIFGVLRSAPSTRGLKKYQIDLLRRFIQQSKDRHILLFMHAPPLSPNLGPWKKWSLRKKFNLDRNIEWYDFYKPNIKKYTGSKRIDSILNFKYQTIMYRWRTLMEILSGSDEIIKRKIDMVFCGHTHTLKEFRIEEAKDFEKKKVNYGFYFVPYYIDVPCKIYTNRYRDIFELFDDDINRESWFDAKKPFIFQTQGLGPLSSKFKVKPPGFRLISIKNNHISNVKVYSMHLKENDLRN
ncbi:MAG: metallophosphoesterase family protein [Promethearchaeati archaeon]